MTIDATVGGISANSYVDLTYADAYFTNRVGSIAPWTEAVQATKEGALIQSTRVIDSNFIWIGDIFTDTQALRWPRENAYDIDEREIATTVIPIPIKDAVCELALFILTSSGYDAEVNDLNKIRVGPITLDFDDRAVSKSIPNSVLELLAFYGNFKGSSKSGSVGFATLIRT